MPDRTPTVERCLRSHFLNKASIRRLVPRLTDETTIGGTQRDGFHNWSPVRSANNLSFRDQQNDQHCNWWNFRTSGAEKHEYILSATPAFVGTWFISLAARRNGVPEVRAILC